MDDDADFGAKLSTWNSLVRRARIGDPKKKLAALVFGSYANNDGGSIRCGVSRFAADCEMGYSTARRYLSWLRDVGLIELVRAGNRKTKRADEYRLTITPATHERLDIPGEDEYRDFVDGMSASNRAGEKGRRLRSPKESADPTDSGDTEESLSALTVASADDAICAQLGGYLRSPMGELPPPTSTSRAKSPPTGGAPPPDPRRPPTPSGPGTEAENSPSSPITEPPDRQRNSPSRAGAAHAGGPSEVAPVVQLFPGAPRPRSRAANTLAEASARIAARRAERQAQLAAEATEVS